VIYFFISYINTLTLIFIFLIFFFNDTTTTHIYTLSLHDALPISDTRAPSAYGDGVMETLLKDARYGIRSLLKQPAFTKRSDSVRSEEHTSELQSQSNLVCRLLLEKKKKKKKKI